MAAPLAPPAIDSPPPGVRVAAYHARTKHRFEAYAAGPSTLDWDAQPAPFRHYAGAPRVALPLARQHAPLPAAPAIPGLASLGALLHLSFGITAWKTLGPDRWAVRANPSSGNLHPVETYVLVAGIAGLLDGLYHYCPEDHSLELRAAHDRPFAPGPAIALGLSCLMWREAWKYGERAFRYCQLDTGHALAGIHYAAATQGWGAVRVEGVGHATLGALLGLDRIDEFPGKRAEVTLEEPELLVCLLLAPGRAAPLPEGASLKRVAQESRWYGVASQVDRFPMFRWPVVAEVAAASRGADGAVVDAPALDIPYAHPPALLLQRRSAQRFDGSHTFPAVAFARLVAALVAMPGRIGLLLFIHRVEGLAPGLYLLPRGEDGPELLVQAARQGALAPVEGYGTALYQLQASEASAWKRLVRSLHCHQEIAAQSCLALGMLARFTPGVEQAPALYRRLLQEAGFLGQMLYLEAEAAGLRGTGIGCFFDDPVHAQLGLDDTGFQSLYHFTLGLPVDDARIETGPAYPHRTETQP